jgi:hypothetical protein
MTYKSIEDLGYAQAKTSDSLTEQAQFAIERIAGFPTEISPESKAALYTGYQKRWAEKHPAEVYAVISGHYVKASPEHLANKSVEKISVGLDFAYSMTSQDFGKLKNTEPEKHALVAGVRLKVQDYCSNRLGDLKRAAGKLLNGNADRTRTTLDFTQSMQKVFDAMAKSVKVKNGKGDTTAEPAKFAVAVKAFWASYNK